MPPPKQGKTKVTTKKKSRLGGPRPGAGRPPIQPGRSAVKIRLDNQVISAVDTAAKLQKLDLATAQHEIATHWIVAFKKYIGPDPHSLSVARPGDVWVDTEGKKFFQPGSPSYGQTREGAYMPLAWAMQ